MRTLRGNTAANSIMKKNTHPRGNSVTQVGLLKFMKIQLFLFKLKALDIGPATWFHF